jgi:ankyrin repeat protein
MRALGALQLIVFACGTVVAAAPVVSADIVTLAQHGDTVAVRALLRQHDGANASGADGTPALAWVVLRQDVDTARLLLRAGADPNKASRLGVQPLQLAVQNNDAAMVRLLLAAHADPDSSDLTGETCLMMAGEIGGLSIIEALLDAGAAVDTRDPQYQQTALMYAARSGQTEAARLLIRRGARVDAQTRTGPVPAFRTPASQTGSRGSGIIRGGWPEQGERDPTPGAKTPLLYAARQGHLETARLLVKFGANLEKADADGMTPLLMAILNGQIPLAQWLIETGANVNAVDWYGETPLWAAVDLRDLDIPGPKRGNDVDRGAALLLITRLLAHGADVDARTRQYPVQRRWVTPLGSLAWVDFTGQTPFLRAALAGDIKVMSLLLAHHADPNIATFSGTTPLMAAAGVNWTVGQTYDEGPENLLAAVTLTQSLGNDVNAVNSMGITALMGAANRGSDAIVRFLAEKGARLDVADKQGRTPLTWAQGVFLATTPPEAKPKTIALLQQLMQTPPQAAPPPRRVAAGS